MTNSDISQQENVSDCGVFVCMFCDYILNGCELNFKQDDVMEARLAAEDDFVNPYSMQCQRQ